MLRARVLTALILLPLVLAALFVLPEVWFAATFWLVVALAAWEWAALAGLGSASTRVCYLLVLALLSAWAWFEPVLWTPVLQAACVFWLVTMVLVLRFPASARWFSRPLLMLSGWLALLAAWVALIAVRGDGAQARWLLWAMLLVWAADIGAYFAGRRFGRRKLAPAVSPGKTWEGALGGAALALPVSLAGVAWLGHDALPWLPAVVLLVIVSVFGDLFESALKRHAGVKDSGTLLPGHGGVLDRVDSLVAVLPFFALAFGRLAGADGPS